jgi:AraC-like DNA-binding protein
MSARAHRFAPEILRRRFDPDCPGLEVLLSAYRRRAFATHIHDAWCVGLVLAGATRVRHGGAVRRLTGGSTALIGPGEPHACNPEPDGRLCSMMFFLDDAAARTVAGDAGEPAFCASVLGDPLLARRLVGLYRALGSPAVGRLRKETLLCLALEPLFTRRAARGPRRDAVSLARVRDYLQAHSRQNVSLAELAALAGLAPTTLLRLFKRRYGLPPHAYRNFLRVEKAKALLATDLPAAQVALEAGFVDQSHLIRRFTPLVGATPGQYRQSLVP